MSDDLGAIISIDLGTTNTSVARFNGRAPEVIPIDGNPLMPSVITIVPADMMPEGTPASDRLLIGQDAIDAATRDRSLRSYMFRHIKRHRGEKWNDDEASGDQLVSGNDDFETFKSEGMTHYQGPDGHTYSPIELEAAFLRRAVAAATAKLKGRKVRGAVLTIPAEHTPTQRRALEEAGAEAGLEFIHIMDEPTAAALAYGYSKRSKKRRVVAVLDVGGGTTDCSIIEIGGDVVNPLGHGASSITGGSDFDKEIANWASEQWMQDNPDSDASADDTARSLLLSEAEEVKKRLSRKTSTEFRIDDFDKSPKGVDRPLIYELERTTMDARGKELIARMELACQGAIAQAKKKDPKFRMSDIHDFVLVGGGTRMVAVQEMGKRVFQQEPKTDIDPELAVVLGGAIQAAILEGLVSDLTITAILPYAIRIETYDKVQGVATPIFEKGTSYPTKVFSRPLVNREAGQTRMPVRILVGNADRASECELVHSFDFEIEPSSPRSSQIDFEIAVNSRGEPYGSCGGKSFGDAI